MERRELGMAAWGVPHVGPTTQRSQAYHRCGLSPSGSEANSLPYK